MGQATFSNNTTIKVSGGGMGNVTNPSTSFTAPANGYIIISSLTANLANATLDVSGTTIATVTSGSTTIWNGGIYIAPGATFTVTTSSTAKILYTIFVNSP